MDESSMSKKSGSVGLFTGAHFVLKTYTSLARGTDYLHIWSHTDSDLCSMDGVPEQSGGLDCGVFIVMYAFYLVQKSGFDFTMVNIY
ncbi:hypothetical protein AAFF_G00239220 [Aldrovandia affinis]|uniref:Uncharacterized protein n=1 Tax=Aldrovandia affinis TaxID=143900 RepID=A0AAD7QZU8_9TELE|nr:hypothetical protein AAFF_G00239220 [Aldrovandia affinis]